MFLYFHIAIFYLLSFNVKLMLLAGIRALLLWTVNPDYFDLIGHLNNFDIDEHC